MIDPWYKKRVVAEVYVKGKDLIGVYQGITLDVFSRSDIIPGRRYMWLKYSICLDRYYLEPWRSP